ncbi:hypothetical protein BD779DRAFT_590941 [Infundibulicybe gibba]|nr:hypothetical protein BD779DRAFT_590941 [Infundibulicybe gibba]
MKNGVWGVGGKLRWRDSGRLRVATFPQPQSHPASSPHRLRPNGCPHFFRLRPTLGRHVSRDTFPQPTGGDEMKCDIHKLNTKIDRTAWFNPLLATVNCTGLRSGVTIPLARLECDQYLHPAPLNTIITALFPIHGRRLDPAKPAPGVNGTWWTHAIVRQYCCRRLKTSRPLHLVPAPPNPHSTLHQGVLTRPAAPGESNICVYPRCEEIYSLSASTSPRLPGHILACAVHTGGTPGRFLKIRNLQAVHAA